MQITNKQSKRYLLVIRETQTTRKTNIYGAEETAQWVRTCMRTQVHIPSCKKPGIAVSSYKPRAAKQWGREG